MTSEIKYGVLMISIIVGGLYLSSASGSFSGSFTGSGFATVDDATALAIALG